MVFLWYTIAGATLHHTTLQLYYLYFSVYLYYLHNITSITYTILHYTYTIYIAISIYFLIQGVPFNLRHRSNSKPWRFRWEYFKQKLNGFKGAIRWCHWFYLEKSFEGRVKVTSNFLNGTPYILLHILIACPESFPKHYNKVFLHWVLFELWDLKSFLNFT